MPFHVTFVRIISAAMLLALLPASIADAGFRRLRSDYEPGETVVAKSRHGNGTVAGVVRESRYGWEVRLPGGTWVDCRRSCEETLRVQTVDIFETNDQLTGYGAAANECGLFRCFSLGF